VLANDLQLFLAMSHGTFCFMSFPGYGFYLSSTAALLYLSWIVHNVVAWMKIKPFLKQRASLLFIGSLCLTIPPIILQIFNNFRFFNNINDLYVKVRPYEVIMRSVEASFGRCAPLTSFLGTRGGSLLAVYSSMLSKHDIQSRSEI
jgi:hypothetical protein